jgi:UrcA family protein
MKRTLLIIAGSALATGLAIKAAPALSEPLPAEMNVSVVRTADLDLSTDAGQRRLDQRIVIAANEVCGDASDVDLKGKNDVRKCRNEVLVAARARARTIIAASGHESIVVAARN